MTQRTWTSGALVLTWVSQNILASTMMTSSNGNIFRVTGHLCGEFTGPGEFPAQRPVTRSFDVFFDMRQNKRLCKQSRGWWFETLSRPLWRHCNDIRKVNTSQDAQLSFIISELNVPSAHFSLPISELHVPHVNLDKWLCTWVMMGLVVRTRRPPHSHAFP